jgi:hypothetical protein
MLRGCIRLPVPLVEAVAGLMGALAIGDIPTRDGRALLDEVLHLT